jgi:hypothetical protein
MNERLERAVECIQSRLSPGYIEAQVGELLRQGQDVGGGINAPRLIRHLVDDPTLADVEVACVYDRLRHGLRAALEQIPSLYYFEGD